MEKLNLIAAFIQVLFLSTYSLAQEQKIDFRKANQEIAEKILNTVGGCGERIWPGYNLKNLNIVLVDTVSDELLAVSVKENKIFKINTSTLPAMVKQTDYSYFLIDTQNWMSINTEKLTQNIKNATPEKLVSRGYRLAIHESFHFTTQRTWSKNTAASRGTFVPIKWEPRYYRALIYKNLVSAYSDKTNSEASLQRAKYWYEKWSKEFPEEILATADGYEGTAKYSDVIAQALAHLKCNVTEESLHTYISGTPNITGLDMALSGYWFSLDAEGYSVGAFASLILRRDQMHKEWQSLIAQRQTPLAILMQNIQLKSEDIDEKFKVVFLETQKEVQSTVDSYLADTYMALKQTNSYYISLPQSLLGDDGQAYSFAEFYIDPAMKLDFSVMGEPLQFESADKTSKLNSAENAVYIKLKSPCKEQSPWAFVASPESASITALGKLNIESKHFKGSLSGKLIKDQNSKNWFCADEK